MRRDLSAALGAVVGATAFPFGYTISIWSGGALLINANGHPGAGSTFAFAGGAVIGFIPLALVAHRTIGEPPAADARDRLIAGTLNAIAVTTSLAAVALIAEIHSWPAWPLASAAVTLSYIVGAAAQLGAVRIWRKTRGRVKLGAGGDRDS